MANLVIALDYTDATDALNMATQLQGTVPWMKVGLELFTREGPMMIKTLKSMGFHVMLDLKLFDIPNTVRGGVRAASWIGADLITVHLLGGERMCRTALEERDSLANKPMIFGVTVLTSLEQGELPVQADLQHQPVKSPVGDEQIAPAAEDKQLHSPLPGPLSRARHILLVLRRDKPAGSSPDAEGGEGRKRPVLFRGHRLQAIANAL